MSPLLLGAGADVHRSRGGAGPLVQDSFTDADSTALTAHAPDIDSVGGGWINPTGTWIITGNKAQLSAGVGGVNGIYIDAGQANVVLTCLVNTGDAKYVGLMFRASAVTDCILTHFSIAEDRIQVFKDVLGVRTEIANVAFVCAPDTQYEMKVLLSALSVIIEIDGVEKVNISEAHNQSDTGVGLWQWDGNLWNSARWDDFQVETA